MTDAELIASLRAENAMLREVVIQQWGVYIDVFVTSAPGDSTKHKAFHAFDRRLRKLGILPQTEKA